MTFQFERQMGSDDLMNSMRAADPGELFVIARCGALANHVVKRLGINPKEAEKCWEVDTDTSSLLLCLVSPDNDKMVTVGIQAFPNAESRDVVTVQVVTPGVTDGTLGVQYKVLLDRTSNEVVEESIRAVTNHNTTGLGAMIRTVIRSEIPEEAVWGQKRIRRVFKGNPGLRAAMLDVRYVPTLMEAHKPLQFSSFDNATSEETVLMQTKDAFTALIRLTGAVHEYTSVPASVLD